MPIRLKSRMIAIREAGNPIIAKYGDDDRADEELENEQEFALLDQISLAGLVNQLRDLSHRAVHGQSFDACIRPCPEQQPQDANHQSREQNLVAGHAEEVALIEIGEMDVHLPARHVLCRCGRARRLDRRLRHGQGRRGQKRPTTTARLRINLVIG